MKKKKEQPWEKALKAAEKAEDTREAQLILLRAKYEARVEMAKENCEDSMAVFDMAMRYYTECERLIPEKPLSVNHDKMKVKVSVLMHLFSLLGVRRGDYYNTTFARIISFLSGFAPKSVGNCLSDEVGISDNDELMEVNEMLNSLKLKKMSLLKKN